MTPLPVGVKEIAARTGVPAITARKWVERYGEDSRIPFPAPLPDRVSNRLAWWWKEVVDWLAATGRLARVAGLERHNVDRGCEEWITIEVTAGIRPAWVLREHDDDTATHAWDHQPGPIPGPTLYTSEDEVVARIRQLLLDGWTVGKEREEEP